MYKRTTNRLTSLVLTCLIAWLASCTPTIIPPDPDPQPNSSDWPDVYDPQKILTLNLELLPQDWDTIRYDLTYDIEVPAMFSTADEAPISVSLRRKSATALPSESNPQKVSLKIDINEYVPGQLWHGLAKLSLENGDDQDVVSEGLAWNLHRFASVDSGYGYDAGFASWVRVNINGAYKGVYISVEQRDKQFLRNRGLYLSGDTWLYKQGDIGVPTLKVGDPDSPTYQLLCYAPFDTRSTCTTPDDQGLAQDLPSLIDMQGMLSMGAVNAYVGDGDALFSHGKNIFFADFSQGKRMYFPWDLDSVFGGSTVSFSIYQGTRNPTDYQNILLNHPAFRSQYNKIMLDLLNGPLASSRIQDFLTNVESILTTALQEDPNNQIQGDISVHFDNLRQVVANRDINIRGQVASNNSPPPR